jgi:hypothetical protein
MVTGDDVALSAVVWIKDCDAHRAHDTLGGALHPRPRFIASDANGGGDGRVAPHSRCPRWQRPARARGQVSLGEGESQEPALSIEPLTRGDHPPSDEDGGRLPGMLRSALLWPSPRLRSVGVSGRDNDCS